MRRILIGSTLLVLTVSVGAQHQHPAAPPTTAGARDCAQAQIVVDALLQQMAARLEAARVSNSPAEMRAAIDGLQTSVRDLRAELAPCAALAPADPHDGHAGYGTKKPPM